MYAALLDQDDWYRRAQLAVEKGDDELAKEALKRRKSNQENADTMKAQLDQQRKAVDQLISNTKYSFLFSLRRRSAHCMAISTNLLDTQHAVQVVNTDQCLIVMGL